MKYAIPGAAFLVMLAGTAHAADIPLPPAADWTGAYAGVFGGIVSGSSDLNANSLSSTPPSIGQDGDFDGWLGGAQAGYDYDFGNGFVLGAVADWATSNVESGNICFEDYGLGSCNNPDTDSQRYNSMDWLATFRARAGFAAGDILFYATGGLSAAKVEVNFDNLDAPGANYSDSDTLNGWAAGGGVEFRLTQYISVGAEYLYVDLGSLETSYPDGANELDAETEFVMNVMKASLNFRF